MKFHSLVSSLYIVGWFGLEPNPEKLDTLLNFSYQALLDDPSRVGRFVGMIGFYSKFMPGLHSVLQSFHNCKKSAADVRSIVFSLRFRAAFAVLKQRLLDLTALRRPDPEQPLIPTFVIPLKQTLLPLNSLTMVFFFILMLSFAAVLSSLPNTIARCLLHTTITLDILAFHELFLG